jgi:hypothetical protein
MDTLKIKQTACSGMKWLLDLVQLKHDLFD